MEDLENKEIETVIATEILEPKPDEIVRDDKGRFPAGVSGNPNGRPKGSRNKNSFAGIIERLLQEGTANGITMEMFVQKMIERAYEGDNIAMRFVIDKTPKPRSQIELGTTQTFELYDLSKESVEEDDDIEGEDGET